MTDTDGTGAVSYTAPVLPDLPPPMPEGEEEFDPSNLGPVKQLWDITLAYGPLSRTEAHKHRPMRSWNYREYVRWHPEVKGDTSMPTMAKADKWSWDRAIDLSLERGWIVTDEKDRLVVGSIPPNHKPMATKPLAAVQAELDSESIDAAMKILTAKVNHARMKPQTAAKNALKRDLQARGQLQPIKVWKPSPMVHEHEIIVDGVTRAALLEELGIEPWKVYLPDDVTPTEVLLQRISHEMLTTTKDTSVEARNAYIAQLAELGFPADKIAKQVDLSRRRVEQILTASETHFVRGQPEPEEIAEFVLLHTAGWNTRDIAERTQWGKSTVIKYLAIEAERDKIAETTDTDADAADVPSDMPKEGTDSHTLLCTLMFDVPDSKGTRREIYTMAGLDPADGGGSFTTLSKRGLVQVNGKRGSSQAWEPTSKAWAFISERPDTLPDPVPLPEPKPKGRKSSTPRAPRKPKPELAPVVSIAPDPDDIQFNEIMAILDENSDLMRRVVAACQKRLHGHV